MARKRAAPSICSVTGLYSWCREVLAGMAELDAGAAADMIAPAQSVSESAYASRDKKALEQIALELRDWVRGLSPEQQASIEARVRAKLGVGVDDAVPPSEVVIGNAMSRGSIETEHEFRVIEARVIDAVADPRNAEEVRALNALLEDFVRRRWSDV